jgi:Protein of unknown function (DUF3887)
LTDPVRKGKLDAVLATEDPQTAELLAAAARVVDALAAPGTTGLDAVGAARELVGRGEDAMREAVQRARAAGATWQEIGDVLGASRQAAFQRFGRPIDPRTGAPMAPPAVPDAAERAVALFIDVLEGRWEAARQDFDATLSTALTAAKIADVTAQVAGLVGAYRRMGEPFVHQAGDYTLVRLPLHFEAGDMAGQVAFDRTGKVAGLHIMRPEAI